jgi:hypothetical protein
MKNKPTFQIAVSSTAKANILLAATIWSSMFIAYQIGHRTTLKGVNAALHKAIKDGFLIVNLSGQPS